MSRTRRWFALVACCSLSLVAFAALRGQDKSPAPSPAVTAKADAANPNSLTQAEIDRGGLLLFDGETTYGWTAVGKAEWKVVDGELCAAGDAEGFLVTNTDFGDYELRAQFKTTPETNSGVFVHTPAEPKDPKTDCYEINIAAVGKNPWPTGGIVERAKRSIEVPESADWQEFVITTAGDAVTVKLDGREVVSYRDPNALRRGRIALQARFVRSRFAESSCFRNSPTR
ncbi:MAG: DUF1080 domain-containing protein [Pirellulales bacterium]